MQAPPFPRIVDATMRSAFISCPQKFYWEYLRAMRPARPSIHLLFGQCFAAGLERSRLSFYRDGRSVEQALADGAQAILEAWGTTPPEDESAPVKSLDRCIGALDAYFGQWPLEATGLVPAVLPNGHLGVELRLWANSGVEHPDGGPVYYAGRYDALLADTGGLAPATTPPLYVCDEKTTQRLGPKWGEQWRLRGQLLGYLWLTQQLGLPAMQAVIRGVAVLKNGYDFAEVPVAPPRWQIERWSEQMRGDIRRMIECWYSGYWDWNYGEACNAYGGCPYMMLCESAEPEEWLSVNYEHRPWNPCEESMAKTKETTT